MLFVSPLERGYCNTPSGDHNLTLWAGLGQSPEDSLNRFEVSSRILEVKEKNKANPSKLDENKFHELNLSKLKLKNLPPGLGDLNFLHTLDLSDNQLTSLPRELLKLTHLKVLKITGNPFKHPIPLKLLEISDLKVVAPLPPEPPHIPPSLIASIKAAQAKYIQATLEWNDFSLKKLTSRSIGATSEDCAGTRHEQQSLDIELSIIQSFKEMHEAYSKARSLLKGEPVDLQEEEKNEVPDPVP